MQESRAMADIVTGKGSGVSGNEARERSMNEFKRRVILMNRNTTRAIKTFIYNGRVLYCRNSGLSRMPECRSGDSNSGNPECELQRT
jgi:hypothetical protein